MELYTVFGLAGLSGCADVEGVEELGYRLTAKFSFIGERVLGSNEILEGERRSLIPSRPRPAGRD